MSEAPSSAALGAATALQTTASDPDLSVWVSANAGSGKTHVLARRVIRLLMRGVQPGRILCLTYTKAAAANMANRVLGELRTWARLDDAALDRAIDAADGPCLPGSREARRDHARRLFAQALETPGGLKIQTIHAFCGALLHAFPFEAGVPAGFRPLEEAARLELIARARAEIVLEAAREPEGELARALARLVDELSDGVLADLLAALVADPPALAASAQDMAAKLGLETLETAAEIERAVLDGALIAPGAWRGMGEALVAEGGRAADRGAALLRAAAAPPDEAAALYLAVFIKDDGKPYSDAFIGKENVRAAFPLLTAERDRLAALAQRLAGARVLERSLAAQTLGRRALARYEAMKAARGALDFADLVNAARRLLGSGAASWVHYKLDQGIDHVLLDEAQDTSPEQWEVIRPLVAEFFAGEGARPGRRTLFVVGDEKQSIFSFQGADPGRFDAVRREWLNLAPQDTFRHIELQHSFRSAPGILEAVDTVFTAADAHRGLSAELKPPVHAAIHAALPALVEMWEPEAPSAKVDIDQWRRPLDAPGADDPVARLAANIAGHIRQRIETGFVLEGRHGRHAARAGDFLILVRRRGAVFESVIRALKSAKVPVAGADRLVVSEHIAVMDLMALGDALISRDDDLALACALKSPLFGLTDEDLMLLAPERSGRLGEALSARAGERPAWSDAARRLERLRADAFHLRPFDFYARVLGRERGRALMLARLGLEAADALDEMLALARAYESVEAPSLPGFLAFLRRGEAEAKRDMDDGRDEVRVMTVHGAKGLEAPYVILADTTSGPNTRRTAGLLRTRTADGRPLTLLAGAKARDTAALTMAREAGDAAAMDEYRRLLYVALTRAESALVLCGAVGANKRPPDCWYDVVRRALEPEAQLRPAVGFAGEVLRWRADSRGHFDPAGASAPSLAGPGTGEEERALALQLAQPVAAAPARRGMRPSAQPAEAAELKASLERGELLHRLLAGLAPLAPSERGTAGRRLLASASDWGEAAREELLGEALATLALPELAPLFAPGSLAEVALAGDLEPGGLAVSGRIDRLAVTAGRVTFADFKTDRHVPMRMADVPSAHRRQVAVYAQLLRKVFPGKEIEALLVYSAGPLVHRLDPKALAAAARGLTSP
ncbi:double-strand break repair helicase AddA [Ancylobacter sp. A5.8]|uniref:double-strand break repair helicase AddA n=1 Tax=Ancylobacter gelatini TaxID=2919920 RepID=UPI001F4E3648|nr:double-strand break repair helicase AddA [Ancylobacter gelatini]MCJ8144566.1 double-strand break repair helicase AddA [Ancylobacter gelatini]